MVRTQFSGREIAKARRKHGFRKAGRTGSHLKLRWESPDTGEVRVVTVSMKAEDEIPTGTVRSIADQCGASDFREWCRWIDRHCQSGIISKRPSAQPIGSLRPIGVRRANGLPIGSNSFCGCPSSSDQYSKTTAVSTAMRRSPNSSPWQQSAMDSPGFRYTVSKYPFNPCAIWRIDL